MENFCICDSCIHQSACVSCFASCGVIADNFPIITECRNFEDKELWVKLPCKEGTTVYKIVAEVGCGTQHCPFDAFDVFECDDCAYAKDKSYIKETSYRFGLRLGYSIFLNKEDAEKELARRREECARTGKSIWIFNIQKRMHEAIGIHE